MYIIYLHFTAKVIEYKISYDFEYDSIFGLHNLSSNLCQSISTKTIQVHFMDLTLIYCFSLVINQSELLSRGLFKFQ